jgi:hypothetical protein
LQQEQLSGLFCTHIYQKAFGKNIHHGTWFMLAGKPRTDINQETGDPII